MALPDDFSPWEHLLEMLISCHNQNVEKTFIGIPINDLENPMSSMRTACFITPDDTVDMVMLRLNLFYFVFQGNLPTPIYGIPIDQYDSEIVYKPQVKLMFQEDWSAFLAENKLRRATAEISFRLMNETSATINQSKARAIAVKIQELFALEGGWTFQKGTTKVVYRDLHHGVYFQLFVEGEGEGQRVIERVLELAGLPFDEHLVTVASSRQSFPRVPGQQEIYGKERRKPRKRPVARVRFYRAELTVWGLSKAIVLVDRLGKSIDLVHAHI